MRFPQLKIGQQFEYQGKRYTKTGPLTASEAATNTGVMIRRSAEVVPVAGKETETPAELLKQHFSREEILELIQEYKIKLGNELRLMASEEGGLQLDPVLKVIDRQLTLT